jgi:hypothetical protein
MYHCYQNNNKNGISKPLNITSRVKQGCVVSSFLFLVNIDNITKAANVTNYNENKINDLLFADDQVLIVKDEKLLQQHIDNLRNEYSNNNMKINAHKNRSHDDREIETKY